MAWTGNFKDQISALTNGIPDDTEATQWTIDGCYDVLERAVKKSGEDEVWKFVVKSEAIEAATELITEIRTIASVERDGKLAFKGKGQLAHKYQDTSSIYEATVNHPVWWIQNNFLHIYPAPTVDNPAYKFYVPEYSPTSWDTGTSSLDNFPSEYYYHIMLYASMKVLHSKMAKKSLPTFNAFILSAPEPLELPDSVISIPNIATITQADITENIPVYVSQSISSASLGDLTTQEINDITLSSASPSVPALDTITYNSVTAAQMDAISTISVDDIMETVSVSPQDIDDTDMNSSQPTYGSFAPPVPPSISIELAAMKAFIDDEDTEMSKATGEEIQSILSSFPAALQEFQGRMQDAKNTYDEENVIFQQKIQEATTNAQNINQVALQNMQKDANIAQQNLSKNMDISKQNVSNEMTRAQLNAQQAHAALMQDAVQKVQETIANNGSLMQEYDKAFQLYNAQVDNDVKVYQQNVQKTSNLWQQTNSLIMQEHGAKVQDELNKYNADVKKYDAHVQSVMAKFQADLSKAQKESDFEMQANIQNYTTALERWQKSLALYTDKVQAQVGEYTQNLQKYQAELQSTPVEYQWLQDQYGRLKIEYEQLFGAEISTPKS